MAHFAEIGPDNIVLRVLVVSDDDEHRGQEFLADDLGLGGTWVQTSYNTGAGVHQLGGTPVRYNYATVGGTYDPAADAFYRPQPYPSWVLNEVYEWEPPTPKTNDGYVWDEDTTSWVKPAIPYPSWVWSDEQGMWMTPVPYPGVITDEGHAQAPVYEWDEDTTSWVEVTLPDEPV